MGRFSAWVAGNISEIASDRILRVYGALLGLTHVLSFLVWRKINLAKLLSAPQNALCWPFWEDCRSYRFLGEGQIQALLWLYLLVAILSACLFFRKSWTTAAWWVLLFLNLFKLLILVQDFQLRLNQHYMAGWVTLVFLFFLSKRDLIQILIAFFYFWAGILKLNPEWFSGTALYEQPWFFSGKLLPLACAYVVLLETVLIWGIFSRRNWIFWATFAQLCLFHIFSWKIVGFFYPTLMFALIAIYAMVRLDPKAQPQPLLRSFTRGLAPRSAYFLLAIFVFFQILPGCFPGDSALTGEGRLFALHMFDAKVECEAYALLKRKDGATKKADLHLNLPARIQCDPIVYFNRGKYLCSLRRSDIGFSDFDLFLNSKKADRKEMQSIIHLEDFCASDPHYDLWRHNSWISSR